MEHKRNLVFPCCPEVKVVFNVGGGTGRLADPLRKYIAQDRPFLGICLGLQLMFEYSEEHGHGTLQRTSKL